MAESASYPVPEAPKNSQTLDPEALRTLLGLAEEREKMKRIRSTRAVSATKPIEYRLGDGTVFLLKPLRHCERKALESQLMDMKDLDTKSGESLLAVTDMIERLAKSRILGWRGFRDADGEEVTFTKCDGSSEFPLSAESLEMIELDLLRQIGTDLIHNSLPSLDDLGKSKPA